MACCPVATSGRSEFERGAFTCCWFTRLILILLLRQRRHRRFSQRRLWRLGRRLLARTAVVVAAVSRLTAVIRRALLVLHLVHHRTDHLGAPATENFLHHRDRVAIHLRVERAD